MHRLCNYFRIFLHLFSFYFFLQRLRISLLSLIFRCSAQILLENASFCRQNARLKNYLFCSKFCRQNLSKPGAIIGDGGSCLKVHTSDHEWPRVTTNDHEWPRVTTSDHELTTSDHERPRVTTSENASKNFVDVMMTSALHHFYQIITI